MPAFLLSEKALEDLKSIGRYTQKTWGREQRNKYLSKLDESFHILSKQPQLGTARDDIRKGYLISCRTAFDFLSPKTYQSSNYSHPARSYECGVSPEKKIKTNAAIQIASIFQF